MLAEGDTPECPYGTVCRNGGCADPCMGITCDDGFTCVEGLCQSCECSECTGGMVCGLGDGSVRFVAAALGNSSSGGETFYWAAVPNYPSVFGPGGIGSGPAPSNW